MRLWSIHPKYLDSIGLVALWRESLLAKKVLQNKTKGYKNHPQLIRFKNHKTARLAINSYLKTVYQEAVKRNFSFDIKKIGKTNKKISIKITKNQIKYEFNHLLKKLKIRDKKRYQTLKKIDKIESNPIFKQIKGPIASWEKIK